MNAYEIPLTPSQNQTASVVILNVTYSFTVQWRNAVQTWFLDIADDAGNPLVQGIALITGSDLLHQHQYLELGGGLFVVCDAGTDAPTFDNLGSSAHLIFATP